MKKLFAAALMMTALTAVAQEGKPLTVRQPQTAAQRIDTQVAKYTAELNLDKTQQDRLRGILTERANRREIEMAELKLKRANGEKLSEADRRASENKALNENEKMKELLTPQQYERWTKLKEERASKMNAQSKASGQIPASEQ